MIISEIGGNLVYSHINSKLKFDMANKRDLKKVIRTVCGDIAGECILARHFVPGIDKSKMTEIVVKVADLQCQSLENVTFSFDKSERAFDNARAYRKERRTYFKKGYGKLRSEFEAAVVAIVDQMNAALPEAQKELNKAK